MSVFEHNSLKLIPWIKIAWLKHIGISRLLIFISKLSSTMCIGFVAWKILQTSLFDRLKMVCGVYSSVLVKISHPN